MNPIRYQVRTVIASVLVALSLSASVHAGPVIDFEDLEPQSGVSFVSSGYRFEIQPVDFGLMRITSSIATGTQTLRVATNDLLTLTKVDGELFDLFSFDVNEGNSELRASQLFVNVSFASGAESDFVIDLDLIFPDFETVAFDGLTDLVSVTFMANSGSSGFSLDNIVVPEPSCMLLLLAGGGFVLLRRSNRSSSARYGRTG